MADNEGSTAEAALAAVERLREAVVLMSANMDRILDVLQVQNETVATLMQRIEDLEDDRDNPFGGPEPDLGPMPGRRLEASFN